jgi:hypothetical protein
MQYSSNSSAVLIDLIRSNPTPVGRYRQAAMHLRDRAQALQTHERSERRLQLKVKGLQLEQKRLLKELGSELEQEISRNKAELLEIDIEEGEAEIQLARDLIDDALREANVCRSEMAAACQEAGLAFGEMPDAEFQLCMAQDFQQKRIRWLAAGYLAPRLQIPVDRLETLLAIAPTERASCFAAIAGVVAENDVVMQTCLPEPHAE